MTNAIANMTQQLTVDLDDPKAVKAAVAEALVQMRAAISDESQGREHQFKAALTLGAHAATVRGLLGSGFTEWMEKNFGADSKKPYSIQWIYKCIGASLAFAALPKAKADRNAILERWGTIKGLASIRTQLEQGDSESLLALPAPEKAKRGAPTKAEREAKAKAKAKADARAQRDEEEEGTDTAEAAADLAKREKAVARKEKLLDAKEARLNAQEEDLNERERLLSMREAALGKPGEVVDAIAKDDTAAPDMVAARKAARKASKPRAPKAPAAAQSAQNDQGEATPLETETDAPASAETDETAAATEEVL